jgi:quaternary ammonium compound-resistance protein SugE
MAWILLVIAGLLETAWAIGLKFTEGLTRPGPTVVMAAAMVGSMWLLAIAARTLPVGTAYAVWVGIGVVGTTIVGVIVLDEPITLVRGLCLLMLVGAIIGLKLTSVPALE